MFPTKFIWHLISYGDLVKSALEELVAGETGKYICNRPQRRKAESVLQGVYENRATRSTGAGPSHLFKACRTETGITEVLKSHIDKEITELQDSGFSRASYIVGAQN